MRRPSQVRSVTDLLVSSERVDAIVIIVCFVLLYAMETGVGYDVEY